VGVEIASTRSRRSSRYSASSGVSRPATSESEGFLDQYQLDRDGDEDDGDDKPNAVPVKSTSKNENISASKKKRDNAFKNEVCLQFSFYYLLTTCIYIQRPMTKAGTKTITGKNSKGSRPNLPILTIQPVQVDEGTNDADIPEEQRPKAARLSMGGLSQQGQVIREVCRDAIRIVEVTLVTQHAWPELHKGTLYKRQVLLEAVNALRANNKDNNDSDERQDAKYKVIRDRILEDEKFTRTIGKWVRDSKVSGIVIIVHIHYH
jgi:hypothetical protein